MSALMYMYVCHENYTCLDIMIYKRKKLLIVI